jgi:DNA-directed RNA polymerase sigma subunit (sigma70/sigma32)
MAQCRVAIRGLRPLSRLFTGSHLCASPARRHDLDPRRPTTPVFSDEPRADGDDIERRFEAANSAKLQADSEKAAMATELSKNRYPHVPERNKRICARYDEGRASGLPLTDLGSEFGINRETVRLIILRRDRSQRRADRLAPLREAFAKGTGRRVSDRR